LQYAAAHDDLTGIYNRKEFYRVALAEFHRCQREGHSFTLALFDIDHFKAVNDTYGHPAGDRVLQAVARRVLTMMREQDTWGRIGGEEFALLCSETNLHDALLILEAIRRDLQDYQIRLLDGRTIAVTVSIGVAEGCTEFPNLEVLLQEADRRLYQAKTGGRNQVCADQCSKHNL
jgi:diguanylate cyclase (GGDEF)-like protein